MPFALPPNGKDHANPVYFWTGSVKKGQRRGFPSQPNVASGWRTPYD
jgi:hypothetical protein